MEPQQLQKRQDSNDPESFSKNNHKMIFQKYSNYQENIQDPQPEPNSPHQQLENYNQSSSSHRMQNSSPIQANRLEQLAHDDEKGSLIESVDKQEFNNDSQVHNKKVEKSPQIPEASSKITYHPVMAEVIPSSQSHHYVTSNQNQIIMQSMQLQKNQVFVSPDNLRHTIVNSQSPNYQSVNQMVSGQSFNVRSSLSANMLPGQFRPSSHHMISSQSQVIRQNQQQFIGANQIPSQKNFYGGSQQVSMMPQQIAQQVIIGQKAQSQSLFQPVEYTHNNPQRIQKSEMVYKNMGSTVNNQGVIINAQNQGIRISRGQSIEGIRENTRSLERKSTNVVFKYQIQEGQSLPVRQNQLINPPKVSAVQQLPILSPPIPVNIIPQQPVIKPSSAQQNVQQTVTAVVEQQRTKQNKVWEEKYFALYSKLLHMNKKVQFIGEDFVKLQKVISLVKEEKPLKRYHRLNSVIQELRQDFTSVVHEWRPQSEIRVSKSKQAAHIEMKYKRLLYNYSKLQEESDSMKKHLEDRIHEVVVKLQKENESLKDKLSKIEIPVKVEENRQRKEDRVDFEEKLAKMHQQNRILQDEISRMKELNDKLLIKVKQAQKVKQGQEFKTNQPQQKTNAMGVQNIEEIIGELNTKLKQYKEKLQEKDELIGQLKTQNLQLQQFLRGYKQKDQHYVKLDETNLNLHHQLQTLTQLVTQLQSSRNQTSPQTESTTNEKQLIHQLTLKFNNQSQQLQLLHIQLNKQQQKNIILKEQLNRVNHKTNNIEDQFITLQNQLIKTKDQLIKTKEQLIQLQNVKTQKGLIIQQDNKDIEVKSMLIEKLQLQNSKLKSEIVTLRQQIQQLNEKQRELSEQRRKMQHLRVEIQQLRAQNNTKQQPAPQQTSPLLIQQYEFTISTLRSEINRKQNQIERQSKLSDQRILDLTEQLKLSYKERQNLHKKFEQKFMLLQTQREKKEILIRQLRDRIYDLEHRKRLDQSEEIRKKQHLNQMNKNKQINKLTEQLQQIQVQKQKLQKESFSQIKTLQDEKHQLSQDTIRLKKQILELSSAVNQLQTLTETLNKKNMEILELRNIAFENEKLLIENNNLKKELQKLSQSNQSLTQQLQTLNITQNQLTQNLKILTNDHQLLNNKFSSLQTQYNTLQQSKEQQLAKSKQLQQSLSNKLQQTQTQCEKVKTKYKNLQNTSQQQIYALKQQLETLKNKLQELDQLLKEKAISDNKILQLQGYKQKYQYQLKQNQQLITKLKSKIKTLESQNEDLTQQIQTINERFTQKEKKANQNIKKCKKVIQDLQDKNKSLQQRHAKIQKQKINQLQNQIKTKQNKIWKLQKELQQALQRLDDFGDQEMALQKILYLEQKVKQYQSRLFNQTFKFTPTSYDYEASKVFERQVIYELKQENQRLKQFISQKKSFKPTHDKDLESSKIQQEIKQAYDEQLDQVQGRLATFNKKLQTLINNGTYDPNAFTFKKRSTKSPVKLQANTGNATSTMKSAQSEMATRELKQLKLKYGQLQRYCKNIEVQLLSGKNTNQISSTTNIVTSTNQTIINDQMVFLKEKNRQLEERVDKLLKMNTQLKENIQNLLKQKSDSSSIGYYKEQISQLNDKLALSDGRIKKLLEENQRAKAQLNSYTKTQQTTQIRVFDFERKTIELQRLVNQLNLTKTSLQKDLQSRIQLLQSKQLQINQLRGHLSLSGEKQSVAIKSYKQQIQNYQSELAKLNNKIKIQESQIQRLNQTIKKKQSQANEQVTRWRLKTNQLQQDLSRLSGENQQQLSSHSSLKYELSHLSQQLKTSQYENQQLKQLNLNLSKKLQQLQTKLRQARSQTEIFQNQLSTKKYEEQQINAKFELQQQQSTKLRNQVQILKQEIQRLNQENRNKQKNLQFDTKSIQDKLSFTQKDLFNLKKITSTLEEEKRLLQQDLFKSQSQNALLFREIQEKDRNFASQQAIYQDKILMLQNQLTAIQSNSASLQENISTMNAIRQKYESQIVDLRNQVAILKSEIERYKEMVRDKDTLYQKLHHEYLLVDEQRGKQQAEIVNLINQKSILNSEIERLLSNIAEKDTSLSTFKGNSQSLDWEVKNCINKITSLRQQNQLLLEKLSSLEKSKTYDAGTFASEITILKRQNADLLKNIEDLRLQKQDLEEQLTRWMNRVTLLGQQNEQLFSKIKAADSAITLSSELEALRRQKQELRRELITVHEGLDRLMKEYQQKIALTHHNINSLVYLIELNRSVYLQVESLFDEMHLSSPEERAHVAQRISQELHKGLKNTSQCNQVLGSFNVELSSQYYPAIHN